MFAGLNYYILRYPCSRSYDVEIFREREMWGGSNSITRFDTETPGNIESESEFERDGEKGERGGGVETTPCFLRGV